MSGAKQEMILVVEDDPGVALLQRRRLERAGYAVCTAINPEEALAILRQSVVDLILLDYRLPGDVDGLDFYAQVRAAGYDVPVILVTGFSNEATVIRALRAGVRDFVTKSPEYLDYLPEAVGQVLRQVRTEQQLAESEARLASIINSAKDAIIVAADDQRITLFNPAAEQMFRCPAAQALGQPLSRFLPWQSGSDSGNGSRPAEMLAFPLRAGNRGVRADGQEFPLEASVSSAPIGGREFYTIVVRDITEKKKLEAQLLHAQRMEGIGMLAGGVAHDFNNLLTIITGYTELLLLNPGQDEQSRNLIQEIRQAGERAAALTRQLLAFSRKQILTPVVLDLNSLVIELEKMLRRLIGEDIELVSSLDPELVPVKADPGQIEQVLINLVVNARDAMPTGGHLTIETRNVAYDVSNARRHPEVRSGRYAMLAVTDTGCGMDEKTKARIFEPFFTTKEVGKGTGLGLATVYGIVKQSGGHIEVYSEVGLGTTFKIYLPGAEEGEPSGTSAACLFPVPRGTETVLLVEDEEGVRTLGRIALQSHGYTVLEARTGEEALAVARQHQAPLDLLVTDVVMPKMGGRQLAALLTAAQPTLRVLYLSGYTDDAVFRHGVLPAGVAFLQKPFTPTTLARKVREVLDGKN
ncbi:MAG TPA: response regulator [Gemmataceae bacterium]|nr:response regulator [Gemmataceae bacterium]